MVAWTRHALLCIEELGTLRSSHLAIGGRGAHCFVHDRVVLARSWVRVLHLTVL